MTIGQVSKDIRQRLGLSQRDVADAVGITHVHLCNVENGRSSPSLELLETLGNYYGINLYVATWAMYGDTSLLPRGVRHAARVLGTAWRRHLKTLG